MKRFSFITKKDNLRVRQKGVAVVEFAIVISLLMLIMGGVIEFGRVLWYLDALAKATRDGARYLSTSAPLPLDIGKATGLVVNAATQAGLPGFDAAKVEVRCDGTTCSTNPTAAPPVYVTVTINYSVAFGNWFPVASGPLTLTPHTTMRYMCAAGATVPC